jgi:hypothetical protein
VLNCDTFTISASDSNLTLLLTRSLAAPKNLILQDEDLIYAEMGVAKNSLITYMAEGGWRHEIICPFIDFYTLLDTH